MKQIFLNHVSSGQFYAYNGVCLICLIGLLWRYRNNGISMLVILLFFAGVIDDLLGSTGRNIFRITLLTVCLWRSFMSGAFNTFFYEHTKAFWGLCIWALYFVFDSIFINHDSPLLAFSLLSKLLIPFFILTLMLHKQNEDNESAKDWFWLFEYLIIVQILLSLGKMIILGGFLEGWVGSMTGIRGGGAGTSFPLLGLMWLALKNDMQFSRRDVLIAIGLLVLGFAAGKRAVWLMFPVLFAILYMWVYGKNMMKQLALIVLVAPLLFYLAVRISPTFNPDNRVWGTFDLDYAVNYVLKYSGGINDKHSGVQTGVGRLGAVSWMFKQFSQKGKNVLFGRGNEYMTYASKDDYSNASYYGGIQSRGSITGIVSTFFTLGLVGIIIYIVFICCTFCTNRNRFNVVLFAVVLFDYIFYNAQILNSMPLLIFALFLSYFFGTLSEVEEIEEKEYIE